MAAARARRLRGAILQLLDEQTPERVDADVLLGVLERLHYDVTARELAAELDYLRQRGYVAYEPRTFGASRPVPPRRFGVRDSGRRLPRLVGIGITDRGSDLVERTLTDAGVQLE